MKNIIGSLMVGLAVNGMVGAATNPDAKPGNPDPVVTATGVSNVTGTVESIDRSGNRVRVRDLSGRISEFQVNAQTVFSSKGQSRKFTDVNAGDNVTLESNPDVGVIRFEFGPR